MQQLPTEFIAAAPKSTAPHFVINIFIARETALALEKMGMEKIFENIFDGSLNLMLLSGQSKCAMPSQHSPDKEPFSLQIPRTLMGRIRRAAKLNGMSVPGYIIAVLSERTSHIPLSADDYEAIAKATREAQETGRRRATRFDDPA